MMDTAEGETQQRVRVRDTAEGEDDGHVLYDRLRRMATAQLTSAALTLLVLGFRGASVSNTGCCKEGE